MGIDYIGLYKGFYRVRRDYGNRLYRATVGLVGNMGCLI